MVPHFIWGLRSSACNILNMIDWNYGKLMTTCWVFVGLIDICVWLWYLLMFSYSLWPFDFCVDSFCNKLTLAIFVLCGWCLWWSRTFVRESRWTTVDYMEWDSFVGAAKPMWWCWYYFGRELYFVNQLLRSWFCSSFELRM